MSPTVYKHHTARIAQLMLLKALEYHIESRSDALALRQMDDSELDIALRNAKGYPREMMVRINERRLFKRAVYTSINDLSVAEELRTEKRRKELEEEISKRAGVDMNYVILDIQGEKGEDVKESAAKVVVGNDLRSLREVSSLVSMLSQAFQENYKVGVYTLEKYRVEVKKAAELVLWR
jgi:HD superfamily phosphohydrolase